MDTNSAVAANQVDELPTLNYLGEVTPGSQKAVKVGAKRDDSFYRFDPNALVVRTDLNIRFQTAKLKERIRLLANDMKVNGFRTDRPLTCFIDRINGVDELVIVDGHTRLAAVRIAISEGAEVESVPVCLLPKSTSMSDIQAAQVRSNTGTAYGMLETAIGVARLANRGHSPDECAQLIGVTATHIDNLMVLAAAPKALQLMIANEQVSASTVIAAIRDLGAENALRTLVASIMKAQEKGRTKVTAKMLPGATYKRELKRSAPQLFDAAEKIMSEPAFATLSAEVRAPFEELVSKLRALKAEGNADGTPS